jgi:hypothetical protein
LLLADTQGSLVLAEAEFGAKGRFIGNKLPVAINLTSVFDANFEGLLRGNKYVSNIKLCDRELCLRSLSLTGQVE